MTLRLTMLGPIMVIGSILVLFLWHIAVGAKSIPILTVAESLWHFDRTEFDHVVIRNLRLPRAIFAVTVGASLAVAGSLMQGVTRNPLAEPGLLGLLAGASFAVVAAVGFFGLATPGWIPVVAAAGALGGAVLVWTIAARVPGGATPLSLILSGAAVTAFLGALITLMQLMDEQTFESLRVWLTGTLAGRRMEVFVWCLPWFIGGLIIAIAVARQVTALAMGEETAIGLGVDIARLKIIVLICVVVLTAASVAVAGPLGFVGLVIPHVVRLLVGSDYRLIVPYSAGIGAAYLLVVDIAARLVLAPAEISTGIVTALLGAPFFVWLVRTRL
ncbi:MAG: iron ABC transporter permease [Loktanella sp.]|nr:iron ABC transporter permease [Loktanella sp.]